MAGDETVTAEKTGAILQQWPWLRGYNGGVFTDDFVAAVIVTVLLVPQSLAYALLAGLPPQVGIYASILPLVAYTMFGSSRYLSVGPTAVISIMTAAVIAGLPEEARLVGAAVLAMMTGIILLVLGLLRSGFIMNFVSRPVVSAYITGAALLIMISQLKHIFGVPAEGRTAFSMIKSILGNLSDLNVMALLIGGGSVAAFLSIKRYMGYGLLKLGLKSKRAKLLARIAPILVVAACIVLTTYLDLDERHGLRIVGKIPQGLPMLEVPRMNMDLLKFLMIPAFVIGLVAFVDSMSTAQTLAARARNRIDADKELLGMGASNFIAGIAGGYPINGSMSRTAVNFTAGGKTPVTGLITAGFMALTALFLTPTLKNLPLATLAALIIVACFSLMEFKSIWRTWVYSRADGITAIATFLSVLVFGVQWGVLVGVILSMALHIRLTLRPHLALVGRFPGTEHYRDSERFNVETHEIVKTLRVDESLYYANARYLEDKVARLLAESPQMTDLVLMCPAVNRIDASALASLEAIAARLKSADVRLHFSELHSKVKERLHRSTFIENLSGNIYLSQHEAMEDLEPEPDWAQFSDHVDIH